MNEYQEVYPIDKATARKIFESGDEEQICHAMVSVAFHEPDWEWAQNKFLELFRQDNISISSLAATCLGHIARIHHQLDKEKVLQAFNSRSDNKDLSGFIRDATDDIEIFVK